MHVEASLGPLVLTTGSAFFYIVISISAQSLNKNLFASFISEELPYVPDSFSELVRFLPAGVQSRAALLKLGDTM